VDDTSTARFVSRSQLLGPDVDSCSTRDVSTERLRLVRLQDELHPDAAIRGGGQGLRDRCGSIDSEANNYEALGRRVHKLKEGLISTPDVDDRRLGAGPYETHALTPCRFDALTCAPDDNLPRAAGQPYKIVDFTGEPGRRPYGLIENEEGTR